MTAPANSLGTPSVQEIITMCIAGSEDMEPEDVEESLYIMTLVSNIDTALRFFGWLREIPRQG